MISQQNKKIAVQNHKKLMAHNKINPKKGCAKINLDKTNNKCKSMQQVMQHIVNFSITNPFRVHNLTVSQCDSFLQNDDFYFTIKNILSVQQSQLNQQIRRLSMVVKQSKKKLRLTKDFIKSRKSNKYFCEKITQIVKTNEVLKQMLKQYIVQIQSMNKQKLKEGAKRKKKYSFIKQLKKEMKK